MKWLHRSLRIPGHTPKRNEFTAHHFSFRSVYIYALYSSSIYLSPPTNNPYPPCLERRWSNPRVLYSQLQRRPRKCMHASSPLSGKNHHVLYYRPTDRSLTVLTNYPHTKAVHYMHPRLRSVSVPNPVLENSGYTSPVRAGIPRENNAGAGTKKRRSELKS